MKSKGGGVMAPGQAPRRSESPAAPIAPRNLGIPQRARDFCGEEGPDRWDRDAATHARAAREKQGSADSGGPHHGGTPDARARA
jgi:hypothetical protein